MKSNAITKFHDALQAFSKTWSLDSFILFFLVEDPKETFGVYQAVVEEESTRRSMVMIEGILENLLTHLTKMHGLSLDAAIGALHGLVDSVGERAHIRKMDAEAEDEEEDEAEPDN